MASAFLLAARQSLHHELERAAAIFRRETSEYQVRMRPRRADEHRVRRAATAMPV
jgi:hypothetical protein